MASPSPVLKLIDRAQELFALYGEEMLEDPKIQGLMADYQAQIDQTWAQFAEYGVIEACTQCAQTPSGACCFDGVEKWYDEILLLINLLMKVELPQAREVVDKCFFMDNQGCKLIARFAICINHLCPDLHGELGSQTNLTLGKQCGRELNAGIALEAELRHWIKNHGSKVETPMRNPAWS